MKRTPPEPNSLSARRVGRGQMLAATSAFLVLAILLLYGFIHLLSRIAQRALTKGESPLSEPELQISASPVPDDDGFTILPSDQGGDDLDSDPLPATSKITDALEETGSSHTVEAMGTAPEASPLPQTTATPAVSRRAKADFSRSRMDVVLLGFDGGGYVDSVALMALRNGSCTFLFLPENLMDASEQPLSRHRTCRGAITSLESVLPLDLDHYLYFNTDSIGDCVEALGGISVAGIPMDGAAAQAYGNDHGEDSLIRLSRLQELTQGATMAVKQISLFRLGELKQALLSSGGGSLTREEYLALYLALRPLKEGDIHARLLPVDSITQGEIRCYRMDAAQTEIILKNYYRFS